MLKNKTENNVEPEIVKHAQGKELGSRSQRLQSWRESRGRGGGGGQQRDVLLTGRQVDVLERAAIEPALLSSPPTLPASTRTVRVVSWNKRVGQSPRGWGTLGNPGIAQTPKISY